MAYIQERSKCQTVPGTVTQGDGNVVIDPVMPTAESFLTHLQMSKGQHLHDALKNTL